MMGQLLSKIIRSLPPVPYLPLTESTGISEFGTRTGLRLAFQVSDAFTVVSERPEAVFLRHIMESSSMT